MPGKLPGGKLRVSRSVPPLSLVKDPTSTEVKYFGLVRDEALSDLESKTEALEEVLKDIQSVSERESEGVFNLRDVSVLDGIERYGVQNEDLSPLRGAALTDGEGTAIVNPRQRLQDRITHFEGFAGRGTPFVGSGPVKFLYYAPVEGTDLPGTVAISTSGVVTGTSTNFNGSTGSSDPFTPHTLSAGDFIHAINANGERIGSFKVSAVTSKTAMTVTPNPSTAIAAGTKIRVVYSHTSPPPFFTESLTSTAFNSANNIPTVAQIPYSHRIGSTEGGSFKPNKYKEEYWEGDYMREFKNPNSNPYGEIGDNADTDPTFGIVKDGNINFELSFEDLQNDRNVGVRYDFFFKKGFDTAEMMKWAVQKYGEVKIDVFRKTGETTGTWITVLDTTDPDTYNVFLNKNESTDNFTGFREVYVQGGPNFNTSADIGNSNYIDLKDLYIDAEDNEVLSYNDEYVPVVIRYWWGQPTVDASVTDTQQARLLSPGGSVPGLDITFKGLQFKPDTKTGTITTLTTAGAVTGSGTAFTTELAVGTRIIVNGKSYKVTAVTNNTSLTVYNPSQDSFSAQSYTFTSPIIQQRRFNNYYVHVKGTYSSSTGAITLQSYSGTGTATNLNNFPREFDVVAYTVGSTGPSTSSFSATGNLVNFYNEVGLYDFPPRVASFPKGERIEDSGNPGSFTSNTFTPTGLDGVTLSDGDTVWMLIQNNPYMHGVPELAPGDNTSSFRESDDLWVKYVHYPDPNGTYLVSGDMQGSATRYQEINPAKNAFEDRATYFQYKYGTLPGTKEYTSARYDGFLRNTITTSAGARDYDLDHTKVLAIGRQKKGTTAEIGTTSPKIGKDLQSGETRTAGENYTFLMYEADAYNNGGRVTISAAPVNSLAAILSPTTAGQNGSGKILHSDDNVGTFSGVSTRQNITAATTIVTQGNTSSYNIYQENFMGGPILVARASGTEGDYETVWASSAMGASTRNANDKTFFIATATQGSGNEAYFYELINATRPVTKTSGISLASGGNTPTITSSALFPADNTSSGARSTQTAVPYIASRVVLYSNTDTSYGTSLAEYEITAYNNSTQQVTLNFLSGTAQAAGTYRVIVYYNYLQLAEKLNTLGWTNSGGLVKGSSTDLQDSPTYSGTSNNMVIRGVYSTSLTYSRVDNGSTLSFGESLFVNSGSNSSSALNPYSADTELPFPPSGAVTPFGFDKSPSDGANPGLGGICYPPVDTPADPALVAIGKEDSEIYGKGSSQAGHYDIYFGDKASPSNLGGKSITVTRGFVFDFPQGSYNDIVTTPSSLPTFSAGSYTHKLRVELTPYLGEPESSNGAEDGTGLFNRDGYHGEMEYIFNDLLTYYSTLGPVKETLYLFAKTSTSTPTSETDLNLICRSSVSFS